MLINVIIIFYYFCYFKIKSIYFLAGRIIQKAFYRKKVPPKRIFSQYLRDHVIIGGHDTMWFRSDHSKYFDIKHIAVSRICWSV